MALEPVRNKQDDIIECYSNAPPKLLSLFGGEDIPVGKAYNTRELLAIAELPHHTLPDNYRPLDVSPTMRQTMIDLALDSKKAATYKANSKAFVTKLSGSKPDETPA